MKFKGSREDLSRKIKSLGYEYEEKEAGQQIQFRIKNGAILNWYPSTGTINFQGEQAASGELRTRLEPILGINPQSPRVDSAFTSPTEISPAKVQAKGKVFVVHGHDQTSREQLELIIHKLGLDPFVLQNTGGGGMTIIEALEQHIGPESAEVKFGIVLLTPDDFGYSKADGAEEVQPRARQNVAILKKVHLEVPSDAQGILYLSFNDHVKEVVPRLVDRLTDAGFVIDPSAITKASS